ncbi:nucleotide sugar dehydrogenase [Clostridium sp. P21]|uniref:Nucleotide sugar dehydrogenase n=2 Tax=Clostridium muellerianum TaxID=2716538 RepID=A0A7Y0EDH0_9CLOT|nr:nucleotide sugar dehydrogenase [Clostridium muellerianum]
MCNVCIIGQGFVGLPLALSYSINGCNVVGVDIKQELVNELNNGVTHHTEKHENKKIQNILEEQLRLNKYKATTLISEGVEKCSNIIITVGIPIINGNAEFSDLKSSIVDVARNLKKQDLILIRSTVVPGTTDELIKPLLEEYSGLKCGEDFYLAYASERIAEGRAFEEFESMPTVIAGINEKSARRAEKLLKIICNAEVIRADSIKIVETAKILENLQRDVNIAMVQEFARFTEALNIDIFQVIKLANTHKRVNLLMPGSGVGGYCIPNAYYYLNAKAEQISLELDLLKLSRKKNEQIPSFIVGKLQELLISIGKDIKKSKIAVIGIAMKDYSNDDRMSPAIEIIKLLLQKGVEVKAFDPKVSTKYTYKVDTQLEAIENSDAILALVKQDGIIYDNLKEFSSIMKIHPIFMDLKAVIGKREAEESGFKYWRI